MVGVQGKGSLHAISSYTNESHDDERKRNELFHIRVVSKHTNIDTLFDPGILLVGYGTKKKLMSPSSVGLDFLLLQSWSMKFIWMLFHLIYVA
jgi:hypothetical protein